MFSQLSSYIFSIFIVFISTSTNVSAVTCNTDETSCYSSSSSVPWCCPRYKYCGDDNTRCLTSTTTISPSSDISPGIAAVITCVSFFFCVLCISCCIRSQRQEQQQQRIRASTINTNARVTPHPYQQQPVRRPSRVIQTRPIHNFSAAPPVHTMHEELPPSYEVATRNLPPKYSSAPLPSAPPATPTVDQAILRV